MAGGQCLTAFFAVWTVHHDAADAAFPARTIRDPLKARISYAMFYHVEHHLFPAVPTCHRRYWPRVSMQSRRSSRCFACSSHTLPRGFARAAPDPRRIALHCLAITDPGGAAMAENKTKATDASVAGYLSAIGDESRRKDCEALAKLMTRATKQKPKMWGTSIVGFGSYHYKYESGREGDMCVAGFSSRKGDISIYGLGDFPGQESCSRSSGNTRKARDASTCASSSTSIRKSSSSLSQVPLPRRSVVTARRRRHQPATDRQFRVRLTARDRWLDRDIHPSYRRSTHGSRAQFYGGGERVIDSIGMSPCPSWSRCGQRRHTCARLRGHRGASFARNLSCHTGRRARDGDCRHRQAVRQAHRSS